MNIWLKKHWLILLLGIILPAGLVVFFEISTLHHHITHCRPSGCHKDVTPIILLIFTMVAWAWQGLVWLIYLIYFHEKQKNYLTELLLPIYKKALLYWLIWLIVFPFIIIGSYIGLHEWLVITQ